MIDNQEEKIKHLIKKAGFGIEEAIELLGISKQTFYNNIRKQPIDQNFIRRFKDKLSIDLDLMETKKPDQEDQAEMDSIKAENKRLKDELLDLSRQLIELLKKK